MSEAQVAKPETAAPVSYENDESAAVAVEALIDKQIEAQNKKPEEAQPETEAKPEVEAKEEEKEVVDDSKIEIDPEAKVFDVEEVIEGGGKEVRKYSLNELKAQRMMQADYSRKTAEVARDREKVREEARQSVETERKRFLTSSQGIQRALMSVAATEFQAEGVDISNQFALQAYMGRLAKDDPAKYVQMTNRLNELNSTLNYVNKTIEAETAKTRQERAQAVTKQAQEAWTSLGSQVKGWNEDTYNKLLKTGYDYGFKPEEIANPMRQDGTIPDGYIPAIDPRFMKLLNDAHAYRQQQTQQPLVEKKVAAVPKVVKPGTPAKADNKQRQEESLVRLKKSGRVDDAALHLMNMMK